ncbi:sigma-70 family RNA polymerase sigma factor [Roseibium sp.]|uniref:sigma-70 family RNA polymerase sigma factor n=1 Tax=Roseibium sp. TaxID=1936156 RepID=UPI0039EFA3DD
MVSYDKEQAFEDARPQLLGVAYRLLGTLAEAEDAVQDTACKWFAATDSLPDNATAWLTSVCTNRCLDILRSVQRKRTDYVGPWLPEQFQMEADDNAEVQMEIASSLTTAFLLFLERLSPRERAAYLLHDIFGEPFSEVAGTLGLSVEHCRKLASRARQMISREKVRFVPSQERQNELLDMFRTALATGDAGPLAATLSADVDLRADSNGMVTAIQHVLAGRDAVVAFVEQVMSEVPSDLQFGLVRANGQASLLIRHREKPQALVSFAFAETGEIQSIYILRNPDKLERFVSTSLTTDGAGLKKPGSLH